jgi:rhodanese-related sulfurtransferase
MSARTISAAELARQLATGDGTVVFDLREASAFAAGHVPTSRRVDYADVGAASRAIALQRDVVLVCEHGNLAALAVPSLRGAGHERVLVLEHGISGWKKAGQAFAQGNASDPPLVTARLVPAFGEKILAYCAGVLIKPSYMLLSLALVRWLRHSQWRELRRLRFGLSVFLLGETACLFNFYLSEDKSPFQWLEALHGIGMAVGSTYVFWGLYGIFDVRLTAMNDPQRGCAFSRFCGTCTRQQEALCVPQRRLRHLLLLMVPLAALPWSVSLVVRDASMDLFGTAVEYRWPILNQFMELRLFPLLAACALLAAWLLLHQPRKLLDHGHRMLCLGLGLLTFASMRGLLDASFTRKPYFADFWEEATELFGVAVIATGMWVFRHSLDLTSKRSVAP